MRQHGWFRPHVRGLTAISSTTLREGGGDIITSIFADGTDGFYFDFSKLAKLWKDTSATTPVAAAGDNIARVDDSSPRGKNGTQATIAAQPKWQTGGFARFDGSDDVLKPTLVPGPAMTLLFKGILPTASGSKVFIGAQESSAGRCHLYMNSSGNLACAAGDNSFNSLISIASTTCVIGAIFSGGQAYYCHNGSVTSAGAYTGSPTELWPLAVGGRNVTGSSFDLLSNPDAARALAIKKALTAAQIAAITNKWGTS